MQKSAILFAVLMMNANFARAEVLTQNTTNSCDFTSGTQYFGAVFELSRYTCASGYYLPANHEGCEPCPTSYTCAGGTFTFDENIAQGLTYSGTPISADINDFCAVNAPTYLLADFTPNSHNCSAGQYLPMGVDACTQCPANSYCVGGTYTFNENINQGIVACDNGYHSSAGASSVSDCIANTITVRWDDGNGGAYTTTCTYGGTLYTPSTPPVAPKGYHFTGWSFNLGN